jgi:hypothetical protein
MNLIVIFMTYTCIVMHSLFFQLPNCNLFTQHVIPLWRDTSSELWTPVHSFTFILPSTTSTVYFSQVLFYFTANKHLFPHYTSNPLFSANQWNWQPHCKLGQSSLVALCAGSKLLLASTMHQTIFWRPVKFSLQQPWEVISFSYWSIKLWVHTEGKLPAVLIIPSSWGFPTGPLRHEECFLAPVPGSKRISARGGNQNTNTF